MSLFKCKMCGGSLEVAAGTTVIECEYCGTKQTLPKLDDDKRANMYDRANHFRRNNEFDKAMGIYENILNEDNTDAEAYWSLVLCRYGIEYVEDPASHKRIPTVNRAQFTSIFDDDNYKSALQYADSYQRAIYESEAKAINEIQKGILAISQKEEPFDVFICYKESDNNGRRTPDSVLAQDLYYGLKNEGFKVFFARITLEDKLGSAYEPYIFAALNSAKVMVVLGTRPEFFNAVWVKNEWSRYLALIKQGQKKMLIPAYKDMDPYDLPEEFSHLQAQDMSKLGFMQDLIRGIKKIAKSDEPKTTVVKEAVVTSTNTNVAPLLERAFMFLEDEDWESADEYCEKVLDLDPKNAHAYLGKLMVELKFAQKTRFKKSLKGFEDSPNFIKAVRFADPKFKEELLGYAEEYNSRYYNAAKTTIEKGDEHDEEKYLQAARFLQNILKYKDSAALVEEYKKKAAYARIYKRDLAIYNKATELAVEDTIEGQIAAAKKFGEVPTFRDAANRSKECFERSQELMYNEFVKQTTDYTTSKQLKAASDLFLTIREYGPAKEKAEELFAKYEEALERERIEREEALERERIEVEERAETDRKNTIYNNAVRDLKSSSIRDIEQAIKGFESIIDWKDSAQKIEECHARIEEVKEKQRLAMIARKKRKRKNTIIGIVVTIVIIAIVAFIIVLNTVIIPNNKYNDAVALMNAKKYTEAIAVFEELNGYRDSSTKVRDCKEARNAIQYEDAMAMMARGDYNNAILILEQLGSYKDSAEKSLQCKDLRIISKYDAIVTLISDGEYAEADAEYKKVLNSDSPSTDRERKTTVDGRYRVLISWLVAERAEEAGKVLKDLGVNESLFYADADDKRTIMDAHYNGALALMDVGEYATAVAVFNRIYSYKDSSQKVVECNEAIKLQSIETRYNKAVSLMQMGQYSLAYAEFKALNDYKDSIQKANECNIALLDDKYEVAIKLMNEGKYDEAIVKFNAILYHKDSKAKLNECKEIINNEKYVEASSLMNEAQYLSAYIAFKAISDYKDSSTLMNNILDEAIAEVENIASQGYYSESYDLAISAEFGKDQVPMLNAYKAMADGLYKKAINEEGLTKITIAKHEVAIKNSAFEGCTELISVVIADGVTQIGDFAFKDCSKLRSVIVPDSVKTIGEGAFSGCSSLESMTIPFVGKSSDAVEEAALFGYVFGTTSYDGGTEVQQSYIHKTSYSSNTKNVKYYIPSHLKVLNITGKNIPTESFMNCTMLEIVSIENATTMGEGVFYGCTGIRSVIFGKNITQIPTKTFYGCSSLENFTILDSITNIGDRAFYDCRKLKEIIIPSNVKSIGSYAFANCSSITEIVLHDKITTVGQSAFWGCASLKTLTLPFVGGSANATGEEALLGYLFWGGSYEGGVEIEQKYSSQYSSTELTLRACAPKTLKTVTITGKNIPKGAFRGYSTLENIYIENVISIGEKAFYDCKSLTSISMPKSVNVLPNYVFYGCENLENITIPDYSISSIGKFAFSGCNKLTDVIIPKGVTSIEYRAFYECASIVNVTIPGSVMYVGEGAFYNCDSLKKVVMYSGVVSLEEQAFAYCSNLSTIVIPATMENLGRESLYFCQNLTDVYYTGSEAQWKEIEKTLSAITYYDATIHYNYIM